MLTVTTDPQGEILGMPPLHNHHSHFFVENSEQAALLNHEDASCYPQLGKDYCFQVNLRPGTSIKLQRGRGAISFGAIFNDARPAGSPRLEWYSLVATRYTTVATEKTLVMVKESPSYRLIAPFENILVPKQPSVLWVTVVFPLSGYVHNFWQHAHADKGALESWYISANYTQLGLDTQSSPGISGNLKGLPSMAAMDTWKTKVLGLVRAQGLSFRCILRRPEALLSWGDRQPLQTCFEGSDYVTKGESITGILWNTPEEGMEDQRQHYHFQWYVETDGLPFNNVGSLVPIEWPATFIDLFVPPADNSLSNTYDLCWHSSKYYDDVGTKLTPTLTCKAFKDWMAAYLANSKIDAPGETIIDNNWRFDTEGLRADGQGTINAAAWQFAVVGAAGALVMLGLAKMWQRSARALL